MFTNKSPPLSFLPSLVTSFNKTHHISWTTMHQTMNTWTKEFAHIAMTNSRGKSHNSLSSISPSQLRPWPFTENPVQDSTLTTSLMQSIFVRNVIFMDISNGIVHITFVTAARAIAVINPKTVNAPAIASTKSSWWQVPLSSHQSPRIFPWSPQQASSSQPTQQKEHPLQQTQRSIWQSPQQPSLRTLESLNSSYETMINKPPIPSGTNKTRHQHNPSWILTNRTTS